MFEAIMNGFSRFKNSNPAFNISHSKLRPLKKSTIKRHFDDGEIYDKVLKPLQHGRADAVNGDSDLDAGEQGKFEFVARQVAQHDLDRLQAETRRDLHAIDVRLKRLPSLPTVEAASVIAMAEGNQTSFLLSEQAPLVDSKRSLLRSIRALTAFRRDNPPVQSRSAHFHNPIFVYPGILAVCMVEMWLNYEVLLGSGGHTPVEILTLVVFTSIFNLLFGLLAGFVGARNLSHVSERRKVAGAVALVLGAMFVVTLAFFMAHYRNAIDSAMDDPAVATNATLRLQRMTEAKAAVRRTMHDDPFAFLGHLHAVLIFLLGLMFGTIAAFEGYYLLDDPYPGYGAAERLYRRARDGHAWEIKRFERHFAGIFDTTMAALDEILQRGVKRLNDIKTCLDAASTIIERYEKAASAVEHNFFRQVLEYRKEYRTVRGTQGPAHWEDEIPHLNRETSFDVGSFVEIEERTLADLQCLEDDIGQIKSKLAGNQAAAVSLMKTYLETVDKDAAREEDLALNQLFGVRTPPPPDQQPPTKNS